MILIADSGSTKTDWALLKEDGTTFEVATQGINPFHQSQEQIAQLLREELLPKLKEEDYSGDVPEEFVTAIYFYGAGCTPEKSPRLAECLQACFLKATTVEVQSDLLGAARALCGKQPGIVSILGTGSNSCYYDGERMVQNTPALGYILGDEGSGATLGKRLVGDCLKGQLPAALCQAFLEEYHLTQAEIIERVYRQPLANRFLASLSPFLYQHRKEESVHQLLLSCFDDFFTRNLLAYPRESLYFIGSIAHYYREELTEVATRHGYTLARILQRPMEGLIRYHLNS
jgi:N-acetylglucosamine kinase-like BadF-type ATPase